MLHLLAKIGRKFFENSEVWCWRRMEKISRTDRVRNEVLWSQGREELIDGKIREKV